MTCSKLIIKTAERDYKKGTLTHVVSSEHCEIFKNTYFEKHLRTTTSVAKEPPVTLWESFRTAILQNRTAILQNTCEQLAWHLLSRIMTLHWFCNFAILNFVFFSSFDSLSFKYCVNISSFFLLISSSASNFCSKYRILSSSVILASFPFFPLFAFFGMIYLAQFLYSKL